ncbi:MAG: hypothetical protein E7013_01940 [Alphaproteobacteria bacterium]|nr:hypothetical protein [Alphaproteobacteria bacterium]
MGANIKNFMFIYGSTIRRLLKYSFIFFVALWGVWNYLGVKRFVYQSFFGKPYSEELAISDNEVYIDLPEDSFRTTTIAGHRIKFKLLKIYQSTGRVIYVDRYTNPIGKSFRDADESGTTRIYDEVVPQDITFVVGEFAKHPKIKGSHEYRSGGLDYDDEYTYGIYRKYAHLYDTHLTNIHTIAASAAVQKGLDILKAGDVATLEGYLIYWETRLPDGYIMDFKSAVYAGEKHTKQKYGGISGVGLCKQLLLTKIVFDGYTFE